MACCGMKNTQMWGCLSTAEKILNGETDGKIRIVGQGFLFAISNNREPLYLVL